MQTRVGERVRTLACAGGIVVMASSIFFLFRLAAAGDAAPPPRGLTFAERLVPVGPTMVRIRRPRSTRPAAQP